MVGRYDVGVLTSYIQTIMSPPTVSLDLLGSALCGLYATTIRPKVISLSISFGISDLEIKKVVLVPFTLRMPCDSLTSSFASEVLQMSRYLSFLIRSRYSRASPVSSSITTPAKNS